MVWEKYNILSGLGTCWARDGKGSVREGVNPTTMVASATPLQELKITPETKDNTDLVVSELRDLSFISA
jgi:hypothetical protein